MVGAWHGLRRSTAARAPASARRRCCSDTATRCGSEQRKGARARAARWTRSPPSPRPSHPLVGVRHAPPPLQAHGLTSATVQSSKLLKQELVSIRPFNFFHGEQFVVCTRSGPVLAVIDNTPFAGLAACARSAPECRRAKATNGRVLCAAMINLRCACVCRKAHALPSLVYLCVCLSSTPHSHFPRHARCAIVATASARGFHV